MPDPTGSASTSTVVVDDEKTFDAAYVKKLNDENAKRRIENKELKTELAGLKEQVSSTAPRSSTTRRRTPWREWIRHSTP